MENNKAAFSNEEIFNGIDEIYKEWCELRAKEDGNTKVRLPDFEVGVLQLKERVQSVLNALKQSKSALEKAKFQMTNQRCEKPRIGMEEEFKVVEEALEAISRLQIEEQSK